MKICSKCETSKDESEFHRRSDTGGLNGICKQCRSVCERDRYQKNLEPARAIRRKYRAEHLEEINARRRSLYQEDSKKIRQQVSEWIKSNRPKVNKRFKRRYDSDPLYKLTVLLRSRVADALAGKTRKSAKTAELLGAPWVWVEAYLEEQFLPGMSWENHGPVWHIDHIRPCASFDLRDPEQQRMCFHWTNLQPLFALDNLRKSDTYDPQNA